MSIIYKLLKEKAEDSKLKNKIVMIGRENSNITINYVAKSYQELLYLVDVYIKLYNDPEYTLQPIAGRRKYIVVDNSINSIATIIALLECGAIPVIIDAKNVYLLKEESLPYIEYGDLAKGAEMQDKIVQNYLNLIQDYDKKLDGENEPGSKLIICSSGSEGLSPHFNLIKEEDLIKLPIQYGEKDGVFYSYISCANISGLLTNIVNPIVHNNKILLDQNFNLESIYFAGNMNKFLKKNFENKYIEKRYFLSTANPALINLVFYKRKKYDGIFYNKTYIDENELVIKECHPDYQMISGNQLTLLKLFNGTEMKADSMMLPRNIMKYLANADLNGVDLSSIHHIYMAGGINSEEVIKKMRRKIPSIPKGVFTNLYGSTEANGVICYCDEKDLKTCYINVGDYEIGKVYYTYDKKTFYEIENGVTKEIVVPKDLFGYTPCLTVSSKYEKDVVVDKDLNILYRNKNTGDLGIYIDNQLYVLGRKSELIKLNRKTYITNYIESYFSNQLQTEIYITPVDENTIQPYLKVDRIENFPNLVKEYYKCLIFSKSINAFKVNPPVIIDDYVFASSKISGKVQRAYLQRYEQYLQVQLEGLHTKCASAAEISKHIVKMFHNPNFLLLSNGSFIVNECLDLFLPINEILNYFYTPTNLDNWNVLFTPKPEIIFITSEHIGFSNLILLLEYKEMIDTLPYVALSAYKNGEVSKKTYKNVKDAKDVDEIFEILKHNILYDMAIRLLTINDFNKNDYNNPNNNPTK